ncbi:hypothetical protein LJK87_28650 [Paenibacillus sp. P25]|nr:hypothetical protein LJK87_28650 [Paenibacillus sp. P25]
MASEEGTTLASMGEKGVNWNDAGPNDIGLDGKPAKYVPIQRPSGEKPLNNRWGNRALRKDEGLPLLLGGADGCEGSRRL